MSGCHAHSPAPGVIVNGAVTSSPRCSAAIACGMNAAAPVAYQWITQSRPGAWRLDQHTLQQKYHSSGQAATQSPVPALEAILRSLAL